MTTYWQGDLAEYTGKSELLSDAMAYELLVLEGHNKGKIVLTYREPQHKGIVADCFISEGLVTNKGVE